MKTVLVLGLLIVLHPFPEQTNNSNPSSEAARHSQNLPNPVSTTAPANNPAAPGQKPSTNSETKNPDWSERLISPVVSNWPLIVVAVWGILVARSTLHAIEWQAEETAKATKSVQRNIALQFRPRLEIRTVVLIPGKYVPVVGTDGQREEGDWQIKYSVANRGETVAHVTESNFTLYVPDGRFPPFPPYSADRDSLGRFTVEPGQHPQRSFPVRGENDMWRFRMLREKTKGGDMSATNLFCIGFIQYRDDIGTSRRTAFCRRYDAHHEVFEKTDAPDYEYAD